MSTDAEKWVEQIEGSDLRDASNLRFVGHALDELERAERVLRAAVANARAHGDSWAAIGAVLGTTRQAAQQRFGEAIDEPSELATESDEMTVLVVSMGSEDEMHSGFDALYKALDRQRTSLSHPTAADVLVVPRPHRWPDDE